MFQCRRVYKTFVDACARRQQELEQEHVEQVMTIEVSSSSSCLLLNKHGVLLNVLNRLVFGLCLWISVDRAGRWINIFGPWCWTMSLLQLLRSEREKTQRENQRDLYYACTNGDLRTVSSFTGCWSANSVCWFLHVVPVMKSKYADRVCLRCSSLSQFNSPASSNCCCIVLGCVLNSILHNLWHSAFCLFVTGPEACWKRSRCQLAWLRWERACDLVLFVFRSLFRFTHNF